MLDDADLPTRAGRHQHGLHACGPGLRASPRGCCCRARATRKASSWRSESFESFAYGDPTNPAHLQGPLVSARQRERVLGYIAKAKQEGARLVTGGKRPAHLPKGYYVEPTIFADVDPRLDAGAGGGLRPGARGHPVRRRRRRRAHRQRLDLRPLGRGDERERRARAGRRAAHPHRHAVDQRRRCGSPSTRRSAATGRAASDARTASLGFEEYLETKVIGLPARS